MLSAASIILLFKENQAIVWVSAGFYYIFFKERYIKGLIIVIFGFIFGGVARGILVGIIVSFLSLFF